MVGEREALLFGGPYLLACAGDRIVAAVDRVLELLYGLWIPLYTLEYSLNFLLVVSVRA